MPTFEETFVIHSNGMQLLRCIHWQIGNAYIWDSTHDVKHLRQTSRTLFEALYNNPLWYAYLQQHSGCACGRCEAPWLLNGWICPVLYRVL